MGLEFRTSSFQACLGSLFIEGRGGRPYEAYEDGRLRTASLDELAGIIASDEGMLRTMRGLESSVRGEVSERFAHPGEPRRGAAPMEGLLQFLVLAEEVDRKA